MIIKKNISDKSICFVSPFAFPLLSGRGSGSGGAERQFFLFGTEMEKMGWRVSFITDIPEHKCTECSFRFPVFPASFSYLGGSNLYVLRDWISLLSSMSKANCRYYVLKVPAHLLVPMLFFCASNNRELVFWAQMTFDANPRERTVNKLAGFLQDWGTRKADYVIAQTKDQQRCFCQNYGVKALHVPSICADLYLPKFQKRMLSLENTPVDILWVGNSMPKKRHEVVFELARRMPDVTFALAMNNSDPVRFEHAANEARELTNVDFLGQVSPTEMEDWFRNTKIFLNTSSSEGFPNTFLQAWDNGIPVLSVNIDPDNLIRENELGRVVGPSRLSEETGDFAKLAQLLKPHAKELLQNFPLRQRIGIHARDYVKKNHTPGVVIPKLLNVLAQTRK